jgi:hypothetical protein
MLPAQVVEISPMVGYRFYGGFPFRPQNATQSWQAEMDHSPTYGAFIGFPAGDDGQVGIRWKRQQTDFNLTSPAGVALTPTPQATLNTIHGEFLYHFREPDNRVKPYILAGAGITNFDIDGASKVRFSFGIGAGVKAYFNRWFGVRVEAQYQGIYFPRSSPDSWCFRGCWAVPVQKLMSQGEVTAGPIFRF